MLAVAPQAAPSANPSSPRHNTPIVAPVKPVSPKKASQLVAVTNQPGGGTMYVDDDRSPMARSSARVIAIVAMAQSKRAVVN